MLETSRMTIRESVMTPPRGKEDVQQPVSEVKVFRYDERREAVSAFAE